MAAESVSSQLMEAATLMLVGMVFVFAFLSLLIVGVKLIAKFCEAFPGEPEVQPSVKRSPAKASPAAQQEDSGVIAAITAAVHMHRQSNK
ncbi:OadG family protein [Alteromonas sp. H39]|uniref:OadG family protein n=1 Tax=Alteromonas sp. H39 TaxID=3389876 RepID=UPI0039DF69D3